MRWSLKQKGWRALLIKMALLTALWLVVAFVFATESYLSGRGLPMKIPWTVAAERAFRDWFPWILLSPVAVALAGRFRFDRNTWRHSLIIHLAACFLFTVAYETLVTLTYPKPFVLSTGRLGGRISIFSSDAGPPGFPAIRGSAEAIDPPSMPFRTGSTSVVVESGRILHFTHDARSVSADSNVTTVVRGEPPPFGIGRDGPALIPPFGPPPSNVRFGVRSVGHWTHFLHRVLLKTQFTVPIYWCVVCICWVFNHFQETSERERRTLELETRLTQANLQTLKMQLQPHFLFNTLNTISSLIHENPKVADDMVGSLSQFLRTTLDVSAKNEVPLRTELDFVERYLEIQQTRFGHRLRICREIDPTVVEALVPPLLLQPLVENAIRYGIESREAGGTVTIRARREENVLRLEISDDGEGFSDGQLLGTGNGIGLSNTKARLQELYGDQHQFKLTAHPPTGACVQIEIPFRLSQSEALTMQKETTNEYSRTHCG